MCSVCRRLLRIVAAVTLDCRVGVARMPTMMRIAAAADPIGREYFRLNIFRPPRRCAVVTGGAAHAAPLDVVSPAASAES